MTRTVCIKLPTCCKGGMHFIWWRHWENRGARVPPWGWDNQKEHGYKGDPWSAGDNCLLKKMEGRAMGKTTFWAAVSTLDNLHPPAPELHDVQSSQLEAGVLSAFRDAAKHLEMYRTAPATKNYPVLVSIVLRLRKPWYLTKFFLCPPLAALFYFPWLHMKTTASRFKKKKHRNV